MKHYRSSIPKAARERVLATHLKGSQKYKAEYSLSGKVVGERQFDESGRLELERPKKNGLLHGMLYSCDDGVVTFAEPYRKGLAHGIARQWSDDGELIGYHRIDLLKLGASHTMRTQPNGVSIQHRQSLVHSNPL